MQFLCSRVLIGTLLCLLTLAAFSQVVHHEFVLYDDDDYITENPQVQAGLSLQNVLWAFTTGHASNWHPLTWLSHMLDCQLYGLKPRGHHVTNLVLHAANTVLLFLVLASMTQASAGAGGAAGGQNEKTGPGACDSLWASGLVAALFAIHPLHVQPVAWVAERKELLAAAFWFFTMGAYSFYVQKPSVSRYAMILVFFAVGLMAKPVLVTLPFALLLLDYWPLGRFDANAGSLWGKGRLVVEKLPLIALSAASCLVTLVVQQRGGAVASFSTVPFESRLGNALVAYVGYIRKMIWPSDLACYYHHFSKTGDLTFLRVLGAGFLLLAITVAVVLLRRRRRYLVVGWFWFLGTLVPMIGLVQVGMMAMADRYTYLPLIGLFIMLAWEISQWGRFRGVGAAVAVGLLGALLPVTLDQVRHWHDSVALFRQAVKINPEDPFVHGSLTLALVREDKRGNLQEVMRSYRETRRLQMQDPFQRIMLGYALARQGKTGEAIEQYQAALELEPDYPDALNGLAQIYATHPSPEIRNAALAVQLAEKACMKTSHRTPLFLDTLAAAYAEAGRFEDAVRVAAQAAQLARESDDIERAIKIEAKRKLYRSGKPYREPPAGK